MRVTDLLKTELEKNKSGREGIKRNEVEAWTSFKYFISTPRKTHCISFIKKNLLGPFVKLSALYFENQTKHKYEYFEIMKYIICKQMVNIATITL